jgi:hypothetical protein
LRPTALAFSGKSPPLDDGEDNATTAWSLAEHTQPRGSREPGGVLEHRAIAEASQMLQSAIEVLRNVLG